MVLNNFLTPRVSSNSGLTRRLAKLNGSDIGTCRLSTAFKSGLFTVVTPGFSYMDLSCWWRSGLCLDHQNVAADLLGDLGQQFIAAGAITADFPVGPGPTRKRSRQGRRSS